MTTTQHRQRATKRAGRAPVVFGQPLPECEPWPDDKQAWSAEFGEATVRIANLGNRVWVAVFRMNGKLLLYAVGNRARVIRKLEEFLKALKRAVENVP